MNENRDNNMFRDVSISLRVNRSICFRMMLIILNLLPCAFSDNRISGYVSLSILVLFSFSMIKRDIVAVAKYFPSIVNFYLAIIAVTIIDYKNPYLPELSTNTAYVGAVPMIIQYYMLFLISIEIFDEHFRKKRHIQKLNFRWETNKATKIIMKSIAMVMLILLAITFIRIIKRPYFLLRVDRFQYRALYITGIWVKFEKYFVYGIPVLLMNWKMGNKKMIIATFALFVLYYIWQGEKYSVFMGTLLYILLYAASNSSNVERIKRIIPKLMVIVFVLIAVVLIQYRLLYRDTYFRTFTNRIAQQGQLWWATYKDNKDVLPRIDELSDELSAYEKTEIPSKYGIYKIMYMSAPKQVVTNKIRTGATYTESTAASIYYYFGGLGLCVFGLAFGLLFAGLCNYYVRCIKSNWIIESLLLTKMISDFREMYAMSRFSVFFSLSNLTKWMIIIACALIRSRITEKGKVKLQDRKMIDRKEVWA